MSALPGDRCALSCARAGGDDEGGVLPYYQEHEPEELFDVKPAVLPVPERARIYRTLTCEGCGESVGEAWVRLRDGKCLCLACAGSGSES